MHATPEAVSLLKPLADFYVGRRLPRFRFIEAARIPRIYRELLDHPNDMTSTLQRFHREEIRVHVLESRHRGNCYQRKVLLVTRDTRRTVEFGAIEIFLEHFPLPAQQEIFRAEMPLGSILRSFRIVYKSKPQGFFEIDSDDITNAALSLPHSRTLYGRCNEITNTKGHVLAEIVEILPPLIEGRKGV
jgi:hypothetical protein